MYCVTQYTRRAQLFPLYKVRRNGLSCGRSAAADHASNRVLFGLRGFEPAPIVLQRFVAEAHLFQ